MTTPNFTAEASLYRTSRSYRTLRRAGGLSGHVAPADRRGTFGLAEIASSTIFPAQVRLPGDPSTRTDTGSDAGLAGTCSSACCGACTCCGNTGGAACCRYCFQNCG